MVITGFGSILGYFGMKLGEFLSTSFSHPGWNLPSMPFCKWFQSIKAFGMKSSICKLESKTSATSLLGHFLGSCQVFIEFQFDTRMILVFRDKTIFLVSSKTPNTF